jgi:hypothetical protein
MTANAISRLTIAALAGATLALAALPAAAEVPGANTDINGKTLYLRPNSWLRYSDSILSRVYTENKSTLEVKGAGSCKILLCPVMHAGVALWARRTHLDLVKPTAGIVLTDRTLRRGDEGDDVKLAQQALTKAGFATEVDGKFGRGTERAVREFQRKLGLEADGVLGPQTRQKLTV